MTTLINELAEIPGPARLPLVGWTPGILKFVLNPVTALQNLHQKYGSLVRVGGPDRPAVFIFDPEYNRQILKNPNVFYSYELNSTPIRFPKTSALARVTTGLPLMNGPRHKDHRSVMLPYFHRKYIVSFHEACVAVTEKKIASWQVGQEIDLKQEMERLAIWLAAKALIGLDPDEGEVLGLQLERTMKALFSPSTILLPYDFPGLPYYRMLRIAQELEAIVKNIIERKRAAGLGGKDVLSALIREHEQNPDRLSERELIGHTATMFRGGYNPNAMALYWTIVMLGQHPHSLAAVLDELHKTLNGNPPGVEQLDNLPLLEGAIKETMRIFPAGLWNSRYSVEPFELAGHALPEGTRVVFSAYVTHRLEKLYPDPYKFIPERWLTIHPSPYEFLPFSGGPRYCIGTSLGLMQLKIALAIILQRFHLNLKTGAKVDCGGIIAIRPKKQLPVRVDPPGSPLPKPKISGNVHNFVDLGN